MSYLQLHLQVPGSPVPLGLGRRRPGPQGCHLLGRGQHRGRSLRRPADSELERSRPRLVLSSGSMRRRLRPPEESALIADSVPGGAGDVEDADEDPFPCYILQSGVYRWKGR